MSQRTTWRRVIFWRSDFFFFEGRRGNQFFFCCCFFFLPTFQSVDSSPLEKAMTGRRKENEAKKNGFVGWKRRATLLRNPLHDLRCDAHVNTTRDVVFLRHSRHAIASERTKTKNKAKSHLLRFCCSLSLLAVSRQPGRLVNIKGVISLQRMRIARCRKDDPCTASGGREDQSL